MANSDSAGKDPIHVHVVSGESVKWTLPERVPLHCELGREVSIRLRAYSEVEGVKLRHVVERAVDAYLTDRGWPAGRTR